MDILPNGFLYPALREARNRNTVINKLVIGRIADAAPGMRKLRMPFERVVANPALAYKAP
jgi:hypothetical protein